LNSSAGMNRKPIEAALARVAQEELAEAEESLEYI
jgi:hypothetical protein